MTERDETSKYRAMLTWPEIESIAADMGANALTVKKWRQRGVPARWKLEIIEKMRRKGVNSASQFPVPVKSKTRK